MQRRRTRAVRAPGERAQGERMQGERLQKVLSELGLASRRQAEQWIRAGRLSVNGRPAVLGMRVSAQDQMRLDGRLIRQHAARGTAVLLCHRSPGEPLQSIVERLPRRAGRRFVSVSPMPIGDGGLELLTADGTLASRLQRAVHGLEVEFSLRVRGELSAEQQQAIREGGLAGAATLTVRALEPGGGEGSNRWYRLIALGARGSEVRALLERHGVTLTRALRTRLGPLELPRTLARGQRRELEPSELSALLGSPSTVP
ncbi:MAG TPA: S4 domain-containing protein [Steroidobacteraceae bacterium]|nr:S4 domain-containing protein [Steroidobacteraceae bacterium]